MTYFLIIAAVFLITVGVFASLIEDAPTRNAMR
jgi:hypothetical protein